MSTLVTDESVTSEHAVLLQQVPDCPHLLDYVKAVASVIGSSHIDSVFKCGNKIKLYLKEKKYVDSVIGAGIVVRGHHAKVEFADPPAAKILVMNLDPIVPNEHLISSLSCFGSFKSNIIRLPLSEDSAYCHILSGERKVYMMLPDSIEIPQNLNIEYNGTIYNVTLRVEIPGQAQSQSSQVPAPRSNFACVNSVQDNSRHVYKNCLNESHSVDLPNDGVKMEKHSVDSVENEDDMFELFSEVNDWDSLLSNECELQDEATGHNRSPTKPNTNVCSVKPIQSSSKNSFTKT